MCSKGGSKNASDTYLDKPELLENKKEARKRDILNNKFLIAIGENDFEEVSSLMKKIDINFKDQDECTPLHWATETGDMKMIKLLLDNGADLGIKNNVLETPLDIARKMNRSDIVSILEESLHAINRSKFEQNEWVKEWDRQSNSSDDQENVWINPVHGYIYQLKILMLFLHRGLSCKYSFRLGTEIKEAKKFDDLVFEYVEDNKKVYRLLQAKHKFDESKKITVDKLLTETRGDYSLVKYFYSFQACQKDEFFKDGIIKDVIICTNIGFDFDDLKKANIEIKKIQLKDDILDMKSNQKEPTRYKFTNSLVCKLRSKLKKTVFDDEIKDFLNHLIFAVNQPNEDELGQIVKEEISREMGFLDTEKAYNKLFAKMMDLSMGKENSMFLSYKDGKKFFDDLKENMPVWFNIQNPVPSFTGRIEDLKKMHMILTKKFHVCITGMGGLGKTELVRKYITDHGDEYDNQVVWINAETYRTAVDSFRQLASGKLNISLKTFDGNDKDIKCVITDVYQLLSTRKSLFIFDNAEKYKCEKEFDCGIDQFLPCLPNNFIKPNVIITSRNQKWPVSIKTINLDPLKANDARELVFKTLALDSEKEKEHVDEMCKKMQFLPLALQQAVAYIKMQKEKLACIDLNFEISNYLERYSNMTHELLDFKFSEDSDSDYNKSVFATWNITLDSLKQKKNGQDALDILNIISFLLPDNIPIDLLLIFCTDKEKLSAAIGLLKQYSVISVQHKAVSVHRLVQEVTRIKLEEQNKTLIVLQNALKSLHQECINYKNIDQVISIWTFAKKYSDLLKEYSELSTYIVDQLIHCTRYDEAISIGNDVMAFLKAFPKNIHAQTGSMNMKYKTALGILHKGQFKEALEELQEVYEREKNILGPSDSKVLDAKRNIGAALYKLGKNREALQCCLEVLEAYRLKFQESHPFVLKAKYDLSCILFEVGKHEEALSMMREVYAIQKRTLGNRHLDTLKSRKNIAAFLCKLNNAKESLVILKEVCSDQEAILPKNHPDILNTKFEIATAFSIHGQYTSAMKLFQELLEIKSELSGKTHPDVMGVKKCIAQVYQGQNKYEKALELFNEALDQQKTFFGLTHPEVLRTQTELADIYASQGNLAKAIVLYKDVYNKQKSLLEKSDLDTLHTVRRVYTTLAELKNIDEALKYSLEALDIAERIYGKNDLSTTVDRTSVGTMYFCKRNFDEALAIFTSLLVDQEKTLGKDHMDCQRTRAYILRNLEERAKSYQNAGEKSVQSKEPAKKEFDINARDSDGLTMLHRALNSTDERKVELLLQRGAEVFITSNKGNTPLHIAALKGQEKCVKLLLQKVKPERLNDFVDAKTTSGAVTALHVAAKMGYFEIVKYLLQKHATFCHRNKDGKTPLDLSTDPKVVGLLKMIHELFDVVKTAEATSVIPKLKTLPLEEVLAVLNTRNDRGSTLSQAAILNKQKHVAVEIFEILQKSKPK